MTQIRKARREELPWINEQYEKVAFKASNFETETIALAASKHKKAGMGRLVKISDGYFELGGILVLESFRGQGIARKIVEFLKAQTPVKSTIFCLPFANLDSFYKSCGFKEVDESIEIPEGIKTKFDWSNQFYEQEVVLLVLEKTWIIPNFHRY